MLFPIYAFVAMGPDVEYPSGARKGQNGWLFGAIAPQMQRRVSNSWCGRVALRHLN